MQDSLLLIIITIMSVTIISTSAAGKTTNYHNYSAPSSSDYAYWNGKKVVKAKGTTKSEIQWMQAALNYCIKYNGLNASYLDVDGSFGPSSKKTTVAFQKKYGLKQDGSFGPGTIGKMKNVLNSNPSPTPAPSPEPTPSKSDITTSDIKAVLDKYNYVTGRYWTYAKSGSPTSGYKSTTRAGRSYSYQYNGVECYGFANFVMHEVTGTSVNPNNGNKNGWKKLSPGDVTELKVGDIVRIGKSNSNGHSGIVYKVENGNCTFAQVFGGVNNKISIDTKLASSNFGSHSTLKSMKRDNVLLYVYRYVG